jgi:hypothetical protein
MDQPVNAFDLSHEQQETASLADEMREQQRRRQLGE